MAHIFLHSIIDAIKIFPIVFVVYLVIEYLETAKAQKPRLKKVLVSRFSPFFGAMIGVIPQCGFSIVATKFYQKGLIYLGTLVAVFIATSDEALPILFSRALEDSTIWTKVVSLICVKFIYAIIVGFILNLIVKSRQKVTESEMAVTETDEQSFQHDGCCGHEISDKKRTFWQFISHPFFHGLKIVIYIFAVNFILGVLIDLVIGRSSLDVFLTRSKILEPLICSVVGLVPNCAVSVALTELYADNLISFSGAIAGLTANSGLGLLVLFRDRKNSKRAIGVALLMLFISLIIGYATFLLR